MHNDASCSSRQSPAGLIVAMVGLSSLHVVDVGYAVMEGATLLTHGTLPYHHIPDVLHGDTYPLASYLLDVPLAALTPVRDAWSDADATLAVTVCSRHRDRGGGSRGGGSARPSPRPPPPPKRRSAGRDRMASPSRPSSSPFQRERRTSSSRSSSCLRSPLGDDRPSRRPSSLWEHGSSSSHWLSPPWPLLGYADRDGGARRLCS